MLHQEMSIMKLNVAFHQLNIDLTPKYVIHVTERR